MDKALYVVNATIDLDSFELSVDKTFEEIKQAYDEGKYSIVLSLMGAATAPLTGMASEGCFFTSVTTAQHDIVSVTVDTIKITKDNVIETYSADLATTNSKLPNPYPLTFTGAVNETYDGSSEKTIEIPSGGEGGDYTNVIRVLEEVSDYAITDIDPSEYSHFIISWSEAASGINFVSVSNGSDVGATLCTHPNGIAIILLDRSINNGLVVIRMQGNNTSAVGGSCQFLSYATSLSAGIHLTGNIPAGAVFNIRGWK